ncbi:MAG: aminoacetone oxidase family FAD-binding enzyme [Coriobacteriia bacterium]|nr:aminoacetone oxidase family FAD-binding enzyme [Coriobacteriia bacterium]
MHKPSIVIVGGGAAGLSAAIAAARLGAAVTLLEAGSRVGRKILASGNGRCNLTNLSVGPAAYNHPDFVQPVLAAYPCEKIRSFFGDMGLVTYADADGRLYPVTNAAASVLEVLRLECAHLGIEERLEFKVAHVVDAVDPVGFVVSSQDGEQLHADAVIVATGGGGVILAGAGHTRVECGPVLAPIKTDPGPIRGLSGVRVKCAASLLAADSAPVATESGELLFRDYGVSGIMIFDLSRHLERADVLSIDFFPGVAPDDFADVISRRCATLAWRTAETFFDGMLHTRVALAVLRAAGVDPKTPVTELPCERLATLLKDFRLDVHGVVDAKQAQVTRGGASVTEFDPDTLESRYVPGLFAAGEVLDIDGRCGGFNLHWAWASGIVAGQSAARFAAGDPA